MSRKLLAILLSELNIVRVLCKSCQTVQEMTFADLEKYRLVQCPHCQADFDPTKTGASQLGRLALQVNQIRAILGKIVDLEFILEVKD